MKDIRLRENRRACGLGWRLFTAVSAAGILAAGIFLLPLAYSTVFRPEGVVEEEEALPGSLETAPGQFMETLWHPWGEEGDEMSREVMEDLVRCHKEEVGFQVYERVFGLMGLEEDEGFWEGLLSAGEESWYLMEASVEKEGRECRLSMAMDEGLLPFLACCRTEREPTGAEMEEAFLALQGLCRGEKEGLRAYTEEIDRIYEDCPEYWLRVNGLYVSLLSQAERQEELPPQIPLWECCERGTWQVCGDEREAAAVCVMGKGSLVLYYDAVEKEVCGYRFWPPEGWR